MNILSNVPSCVDLPSFLDGCEEANELVREVQAGAVPIDQARRWIRELYREGLARLAAEVESRLPLAH